MKTSKLALLGFASLSFVMGGCGHSGDSTPINPPGDARDALAQHDGAIDVSDSTPRADAELPDTTNPIRVIDERCTDGEVHRNEVLPIRSDITDLLNAFSANNKLAWSIQVLNRRYPTGGLILEKANNDTNCFDVGVSGASSATEVLAGLRTSVHECGHMVDLNQKTFVLGKSLSYDCDFAVVADTPPRRILVDDEYQALWPKDEFKQDYLVDLGDQALAYLMTEALQYINTLATSYALYDYAPFDPIARDGTHAFQWYVTRYLRLLRMNYSTQYSRAAGDRCWRRLVLAGWGRAHRYLAASKGMPDLGGADDALLERLVTTPELVDEIRRLRVADGCP
ncbi:MAG: hypothetical protein HY698_11420 [Deltaproteobacteria bacterium]|nr:hypothetical protein [Deltaproteobacteria bacterium]